MRLIDAERIVSTNNCPTCGQGLVIHPKAVGDFEVRCPSGHVYPEEGLVPYAITRELKPEEIKANLDAVRKLQQLVMKKGIDYGRFPGTTSKSLFKPGAEKLRLAFWLRPNFSCLERVEDWDKGFFFYKYRCEMATQDGMVLGVAERGCHTKEDRYRYRWVDEGDIPPGVDPRSLKTRKIKEKTQEKTQYRVENEDTWSLQNTVMSMAQKRAFVAATLMATGASALFTEEGEEIEETTKTITRGEWKAFWDRVKGLGLTAKQAHELLGVKHMEEYLAQGRTLDEAIDELKGNVRLL